VFVVVVREEGTNGTPGIYRGKDVVELLASVRRKYKGRKKPAWFGRRTNDFIVRHYNKDMSAQQIADALSVKRAHRITKNMVIKRAAYLGLCVPKEGKPSTACEIASQDGSSRP
jgi:hypothetical protein